MKRKEFTALQPAILTAAIAVEPTVHRTDLQGTAKGDRPSIFIAHSNPDKRTAKRAITAAVRDVVPNAKVTCYVDDPLAADAARRGRPLEAAGNLADIMRERSLTRVDLAHNSGVSASTIDKLSAGRAPRYTTATAIAAALNVSPLRIWPA